MNRDSQGPGRYSPLPPPVEPLPRHVAIIMDGNGRWARTRGFLRLRGHEHGAESLRRITRHCARIGISELTFYALSTENFRRRPRGEVDFLMGLLGRYLIDEREELAEGNIRLRAIGRTGELPAAVRRELATTVEGSAGHTGMTLRLALNYGGRGEILDAVQSIVDAASDPGSLSADRPALDEEGFRRYLYDPDMSDPDIVIRTAGETRLSNFLLWQASYAEIWVTEVLWPDFDIEHLEEALRYFVTRRRKFGGIAPDDGAAAAKGSPLPESESARHGSGL